MTSLELDREISKIARAMMTRNSQIGLDLIAHLRTQLTLKYLAGMLLVSIERLLWFDSESAIWAIEHLIPADLMQEIQTMTSVTIYKQLIAKGFVPGQDLSIDADGKLLLKKKLRTAA